MLTDYVDERILVQEPFFLNSGEDNYLIYVIENKIALLTKLGRPTAHNNMFLYRLESCHITKPNARISFGINFGSNINNIISIHPMYVEDLLRSIDESEYSLHYYLTNANDLLEREKIKTQKQYEIEHKNNQINQIDILEDTTYKNIKEPHLKAQYILKELANIIGFDGFIAKNDQNRIYKNNVLSYNSLNDIPDYSIPKELERHISLIDVLWFNNEVPVACFEVEMSTSVYSGILRMADFICTIKNPNTELYLVTTKSREKKILKELNRPIFQQIGLSQMCKVIFLEELEVLYSLVKTLKGHIKENILDRISHSY